MALADLNKSLPEISKWYMLILRSKIIRKKTSKKGHQNVKFTEKSPINYVIQLLGWFEICILL